MPLWHASWGSCRHHHIIPAVVHVNCPHRAAETLLSDLKPHKISYICGFQDNINLLGRTGGALATSLRDGSAMAALDDEIAVSIYFFSPFSIDIRAAHEIHSAFNSL